MKTRAFCNNLNCRGSNFPAAFANRLVYANGSTPGGTEGQEKVTLDNVAEQLSALEDSGKLKKAAVTKALTALESGDAQAKEKILKLTEKVLDGTYDSGDFAARLPKVSAGAEGQAETATAKPAATPETPAAQVKKISDFLREKIQNAVGMIEEVEAQLKSREDIDQEVREKFAKVGKNVKALNELDRKNSEETDGKVKTLLDGIRGKFNEKEYKEIMELDGLDPDFEKFTKAIDARNFDAETDKALTKIFKLKMAQAEKNRKIEEDLRKALHEFREVMQKVSDAVMEKARQKKAVDSLTRATGISVKPGTRIAFLGLMLNKEGRLVPTNQIATIKEVKFLDKAAPVIIIEKTDAEGKPVEEIFSMVDFIRFADAMGATEDINTLSELESSIGMKVATGDNFDYVVSLEATDKFVNEDNQVKIEKIDEADKQITMSREVNLSPGGTPARLLTYGEFSKWAKRREAEKVIPNLQELQEKLALFNDVQNAAYERDPKKYPPIKGEVNEILKYDDGTGRDWVIREINDKEVKLDGEGNKFTLAGFYRWVKKNEVEKFDVKAEAAKGTEISGSDADREKLEKELEAAKKKRLEEAEKEPGKSSSHHDSNHNAEYSVSYIKKIWANTKFISPHGLMEMGKTFIELIKRKLKRSEHDRVGIVGQQMFGSLWPELGAEFKSVAQHAENEEVKHHADHYRTMGKGDVIHELHAAPTKDILKAAVTVLTEKGTMRWDDPEFWKAMNKYTYGALIDEKTGGPLRVHSGNHMDAIEKYMDHWWGQDTFREFRQKQDSSYNSTRTAFTDHAKRLENDPDRNGGLKFQLQKMLWQHLNGQHVNAAQFESYLHFAIDAGKLGFADKLFFLMMAVGQPGKGAGGHDGQTLLHIDRVAALEGELMNKFPVLDFFTDPDMVLIDANGNVEFEEDGKTPSRGRPGINNFQFWIKESIGKDLGGSALNVSDPVNLKPGEYLDEFVNRRIIWNDAVRTRLEKAAKSTIGWDHDDMHKIAGGLSEALVEQILIKQGGATAPVSLPGLKNTVAGLNDFIKLKIDMVGEHSKSGAKDEAHQDMRQLTNLLKTFVKLDGMLDERNGLITSNYSKFYAQDWDSVAGAEQTPGRTVREMSVEVRNYVGKLVHRLDAQTGGKYRLSSSWKDMIQKKTTKDEKDKQTETAKSFGDFLDGALSELTTTGVNVADIFTEVQNEGGKSIVKGIISASYDKTKGEEKRGSIYEFRAYKDQVVLAKIEELKDLSKKIIETPTRTPDEIKKIGNARVRTIMHDFDAGTYTAQPEDAGLLDKEITNLRNRLERKKTGQAPEEGGGGPTSTGA